MSKDNVTPLRPGTEPSAKVQQAAPCPEGPWPATAYMDADGCPTGPHAPIPPPKPWASTPEPPPADPPHLPTAIDGMVNWDDEPLSPAMIDYLCAHNSIPAEEVCHFLKRKFETGQWHATDPAGRIIPADKWRWTAITPDGRASGWGGVNEDWFRVIRRPAPEPQVKVPPAPEPQVKVPPVLFSVLPPPDAWVKPGEVDQTPRRGKAKPQQAAVNEAVLAQYRNAHELGQNTPKQTTVWADVRDQTGATFYQVKLAVKDVPKHMRRGRGHKDRPTPED